MELLVCIGSFFSLSWDFFTEVAVPGTSFTFAALLVGLFLASFSLRILSSVLGLSFRADDVTSVFASSSFGYSTIPGYRPGVAISEPRRNDEF